PWPPLVQSENLVRARDRHDEVLAHHVLAGDHLLGFAALFVEHDGGKLLQGLARFVQGAAMRVHTGQLFDEPDVAGVGLEIHSGKGETTLFHSFLLPECRQVTPSSLQKYYCRKKNLAELILQNRCGSIDDKKILHRAN